MTLTESGGVAVQPLLTSGEAVATKGSPARPRRATRVATWVVLGLAGALATLLVINDLAHPRGLYGILEYDDGVNFAASLRLVSGVLAYKDFTFLQPPGIAVVLAPFAIIAHHSGTLQALAYARIFTAFVAGANAILCGVLVRHRGLAATTVASVAMAVFPPAYFADHTAMLEPYLVLFCLIGANFVLRRGEWARTGRLIAGGAAFGIAGSVKVFAIIPVVVLLALMARRPRRLALPFAGGVVIGFVVICGPFFVAAPGAFLHDVIVTQLARQALIRSGLHTRLWSLTGLRGYSRFILPTHSNHLPDLIAWIEVAVLSVTAIIPALLRRGDRAEWFVTASAVGAVIAILVPAQFYAHYVYFAAAFLAPMLACAAQRCLNVGTALLALRKSRSGRRIHFALGTVLGVLAIIGISSVVLTETAFDAGATAKTGVPGPFIAAAVPPGACVLTDAAVLTITANRFFSTKANCPVEIDSSGTWIADDPDQPPNPHAHARVDPKLVADWFSWFSEADYVVMSTPMSFRIPWTPALTAYFNSHFTRLPVPAAVYKKVTPHSKASTTPKAAATSKA